MLVADQPDNLTLCGYNLNDRLRDPEVFQSRAYDLIHSQFVSPGIKGNRWVSYIQDIKLLLRPGGWVQLVEYYPLIQSDSGQLTDQSAVRRWWLSYEASMRRLQRDPRIGRRFNHLLTQHGYRDVAVNIQHLPIGGWHLGKSKTSAHSEVFIDASCRRSALCVALPLRSIFSADGIGVDPTKAEIGRDSVSVSRELTCTFGLS